MFDSIRYNIHKFFQEKRARKLKGKEWDKFCVYQKKIHRALNYDLKMSKQFEDNVWLWDTNRFLDQFTAEIQEHKIEVSYSSDFSSFATYIIFVKWLSCTLKRTGDEEIIKLIQEYVKYGIKHYDAVVCGRPIIKYFNYPIYPLMIYDAWYRKKYGTKQFFDIYDENAEIIDYFNAYYEPSFDINMPGVPEIKIIDNGNDIVFEKMQLPPDDASPEEIEKWLKESWEKFKKELDEDMPEEILKEEQEIMRRFEEDANRTIG